jgi:hypothetical protein
MWTSSSTYHTIHAAKNVSSHKQLLIWYPKVTSVHSFLIHFLHSIAKCYMHNWRFQATFLSNQKHGRNTVIRDEVNNNLRTSKVNMALRIEKKKNTFLMLQKSIYQNLSVELKFKILCIYEIHELLDEFKLTAILHMCSPCPVFWRPSFEFKLWRVSVSFSCKKPISDSTSVALVLAVD